MVDRLYAEVHHIMPRNKHNGPDVRENMLVLCPNHHVEFDFGVLCIDPKSQPYEFLHKYDSSIDEQEVTLQKGHHLDKGILVFAKQTFYDVSLQIS